MGDNVVCLDYFQLRYKYVNENNSGLPLHQQLPVSDDFFGEIPPLTNEEISHYQTLAKSWVEGLLDASTSSEVGLVVL